MGGEKGDEGVGLHLQEWKMGKEYKKGDYVFVSVKDKKTKKEHDMMYICSKPIKRARKKPQHDSKHWVHFKAPRGERGLKGEKGERGPRGERGSVGPAGNSIKGPKGNPGANGKDCNDGNDGLNGKDGKDGSQGEK